MKILARTTLISTLAIAIFLGCSGKETKEEYWPDGSIKSRWTEIKRKDGKYYKHGDFTSWHKNGEKAKEGVYEYGNVHGEWFSWYDNGLKNEENEYENGNLLRGKWMRWYENGEKQFEDEITENGKRKKRTTWYPNGQIEKISESWDDMKHRRKIKYKEDGEIILDKVFEDGNWRDR